MSHTVTFSSGVYVGVRGSGNMTADWFGEAPVQQFTSFSLTADELQPLAAIDGIPSRRKPLLLRFTGSGLAGVEEKLHEIEAYPLLNGQPRRTLSGTFDVVAGKGYLAKLSTYLLGDFGGSPKEEWGVLANLQVNIANGARGWAVTATFFPCDVLWHAGTDDVFAVAPPPAEEDDNGGIGAM